MSQDRDLTPGGTGPAPHDLGAAIEEVLRLDAQASRGPWAHPPTQTDEIHGPVDDETGEPYVVVEDGEVLPEDAQLIARFRTLAPMLAKALKERIEHPWRCTCGATEGVRTRKLSVRLLVPERTTVTPQEIPITVHGDAPRIAVVTMPPGESWSPKWDWVVRCAHRAGLATVVTLQHGVTFELYEVETPRVDEWLDAASRAEPDPPAGTDMGPIEASQPPKRNG